MTHALYSALSKLFLKYIIDFFLFPHIPKEQLQENCLLWLKQHFEEMALQKYHDC